MVTRAAPAGVTTAQSTSFERFAGFCGILAALSGFLYSIAFVVLRSPALSALFLMLGGLLASAVLVAVYRRLHETDPGFALWGFALGLAAAVGSALHGGYDLANVLTPPSAANVELPSAVDPRGLLTFGVAGLSVFVIAWLIGQGRQFPSRVATVGYLLGFLLVIIYLARLIVVTPTSPLVLIPALLAGFIANPLWYLLLGLALWRGEHG